MRFVTATLVGLGIMLFVSVIEFRTGTSAFFAVLGAAAAAFVGENLNIRMNRWAEERGQKLALQKDRDEAELRIRSDEILEKISREGMESLSAEEKRILKKASKLMAGKSGEKE